MVSLVHITLHCYIKISASCGRNKTSSILLTRRPTVFFNKKMLEFGAIFYRDVFVKAYSNQHHDLAPNVLKHMTVITNMYDQNNTGSTSFSNLMLRWWLRCKIYSAKFRSESKSRLHWIPTTSNILTMTFPYSRPLCGESTGRWWFH